MATDALPGVERSAPGSLRTPVWLNKMSTGTRRRRAPRGDEGRRLPFLRRARRRASQAAEDAGSGVLPSLAIVPAPRPITDGAGLPPSLDARRWGGGQAGRDLHRARSLGSGLSVDDLSLLEVLLFFTYTTDQQHAFPRAATALLAELVDRRRLVLGGMRKIIIHAAASTSDHELDEVLRHYIRVVGRGAMRPEKALLVLMDAWAGLRKTVGHTVEGRLLDYGVARLGLAAQSGVLGNQWTASRWLADEAFREQLYREARRLVRAGAPLDTDHSLLIHVLNTSPAARQVFGPGLDRAKIARLCRRDPLAHTIIRAYDSVCAGASTWSRRT